MGRVISWLNDVELVLECTNYENIKIRVVRLEKIFESDIVKIHVEITKGISDE